MLKNIRYVMHSEGQGIQGLCGVACIDQWYDSKFIVQCTVFYDHSSKYAECIECLCQSQEALYAKEN